MLKVVSCLQTAGNTIPSEASSDEETTATMAAAAASCGTVLGFRTNCACCSRKKFPGLSRNVCITGKLASRAFDRCKHVGLAPELFFGRKVGGLLVQPLYIYAI